MFQTNTKAKTEAETEAETKSIQTSTVPARTGGQQDAARELRPVSIALCTDEHMAESMKTDSKRRYKIADDPVAASQQVAFRRFSCSLFYLFAIVMVILEESNRGPQQGVSYALLGVVFLLFGRGFSHGADLLEAVVELKQEIRAKMQSAVEEGNNNCGEQDRLRLGRSTDS